MKAYCGPGEIFGALEIGGDVPNEETRKAMEDVQRGIGLSRAFSSVEELMEELETSNETPAD